MNRFSACFGLFCLVALSSADMYLHNPRGSNDGALITSFKSPALRDDEVNTGKLAASHRKWSPITFVVLGGKYATKATELDFLEDAFKNHKTIELNFSMVNAGPSGNRRVIYRSQFQNAKIQSLTKSMQGTDPKITITFTFATINLTDATGKAVTDNWS